MQYKLICILLILVSFAYADLTPHDDWNFRDEYSLKNAVYLNGTNICIGDVCKSAWPDFNGTFALNSSLSQYVDWVGGNTTYATISLETSVKNNETQRVNDNSTLSGMTNETWNQSLAGGLYFGMEGNVVYNNNSDTLNQTWDVSNYTGTGNISVSSHVISWNWASVKETLDRLYQAVDSYITADNVAFTNISETFELDLTVNNNLNVGHDARVDGDLILGGDILHINVTAININETITLTNLSQDIAILLNASGDSYFLGGNVGIGTGSPSAPLNVVGTAIDFKGVLDIQDDSEVIATADSFISFWGSDAGDGATNRGGTVGISNGDMYLLNSLAGNLFLGTSDANKLTIDSSGNIGIGTTAPNAKLEVIGNTAILGNFSVDTNVLFVDNTTDRVGIGTNAPDGKLHVEGTDPILRITNTNTVTGSIASLGFEFGTPGETARIQAVKEATSYNTGLLFKTWQNGVWYDTMYMQNGNVGIGTVNPNAKLHVETGDVQFNGTGSASGFYWDESAGNLGIGTTAPSHKLNVYEGNFNTTNSGNSTIYIGENYLQSIGGHLIISD